MKIIITKNYSKLSQKASEVVIEEMASRANLVMGLATGSTPLGLYEELIKAEKDGKIDFSRVTTFNLDEYYPIKKTNKNSYSYFMFSNLFNKVRVRKNKVNILDGETESPQKECKLYQNKLRRNEIDVQILGIGTNGHIGFNEPGSSFKSRTRLVNLTKKTIKDNSRFFIRKKNIPEKALTMGIADIMDAKKIVLLASGLNKARAVKKMLEGPIDESCPASILRKHPNTIVILDEKAASLLKEDRIPFDIEKTDYRILTEGNMPRKKRILFISPHPDDVSINCGGTVALLSKYNKISAFIMTTGYRSYVPNKTKKEIIQIREKETIKEAKVLNFTPYFLRLNFYDDYKGKFEESDIKEVITKLKKINPDIIFIPQKNDKHSTHKLSRNILLKCLKKIKKRVVLWNYETMWSLFSTGEFNLIVPFSRKILKLKSRAIKQHKSQTNRIPYDVAALSLSKLRGAIIPEQLFGYGERSFLKNKSIELFFIE